MGRVDRHRASVERSFRTLEAGWLEAEREAGFNAAVGAAATHLGLMLHALCRRGLEVEAQGAFEGTLAVGLSGQNTVLAPDDSLLWGAPLKALRWGSIVVDMEDKVILIVELKESPGGFIPAEDKSTALTALARAGQPIESALLVAIQDSSLAATLGALGTFFGQMLYTMRKQGKAPMAITAVKGLKCLMESGRSTGSTLVQ